VHSIGVLIAENDLTLIDLLGTLSNSVSGKLLLVGDFNFKNINWTNCTEIGGSNSNSSARKFLDCLKQNYLTQHVLEPTRARGSQTPSLLDLIISNDEFIDNIDNLSPLGKSDHSVLCFNCSLTHPVIVSKVPKFNYQKGNYDDLKVYVAENIKLADNSDDVCGVINLWNKLHDTLDIGVKSNIPVIKSSTWRRKESWRFPISNDLRQIICRKHRLWTRYQETKDSKFLNEFKHCRNLIRKETRNLTHKVQLDIAKSCKQNPKKFWQFVKSKTQSSSGIGDLRIKIGNNSVLVDDDSEKAEQFSRYFSKIYTLEPTDEFVKLPDRMPQNSMPQIIITESKVAEKLSNLKLDKSPGPDLIHPRVLFELRNVIVGPLTTLYTESMRLGLVPDVWKTSIVSVLYKKGRKDDIGNYRPISLTCIICKIMESIICDQVMNYFVTNNLFSEYQYGFIKGRSAVLQLIRILNDWTKSIDAGNQVDIIYTDFEKAFDKVPHRRLLSKLHSYGVNNELINWIESYLCGRSQRVKINGETSVSRPVLSGIPQGSVLGPLLFVIFINDLPDVCAGLCDIFLFADDAKLYKCISSESDADMLNLSFKNVLDWSEKWFMKLNLSKCKVLSVNNIGSSIEKFKYGCEVSNIPDEISITLNREVAINDLGVTIDSELTFNNHVYEKINMANKMLGIIKRNFIDVDKSTFLILYKCFVRSHLEYAHSVWNSCSIGIIHDIERVQKQATKSIRECKHMAYKDRLVYLQLPTLRYRRLRGDMIDVYKIMTDLYAASVSPTLPRNLDTRTRGNTCKLAVERSRLDLRKYSFCNRVIIAWNSLPNSVVTSVSLNSFKCNLDNFWKPHDFYFDYKSVIAASYH
jgi:hypothetical protein